MMSSVSQSEPLKQDAELEAALQPTVKEPTPPAFVQSAHSQDTTLRCFKDRLKASN